MCDCQTVPRAGERGENDGSIHVARYLHGDTLTGSTIEFKLPDATSGFPSSFDACDPPAEERPDNSALLKEIGNNDALPVIINDRLEELFLNSADDWNKQLSCFQPEVTDSHQEAVAETISTLEENTTRPEADTRSVAITRSIKQKRTAPRTLNKKECHWFTKVALFAAGAVALLATLVIATEHASECKTKVLKPATAKTAIEDYDQSLLLKLHSSNNPLVLVDMNPELKTIHTPQKSETKPLEIRSLEELKEFAAAANPSGFDLVFQPIAAPAASEPEILDRETANETDESLPPEPITGNDVQESAGIEVWLGGTKTIHISPLNSSLISN